MNRRLLLLATSMLALPLAAQPAAPLYDAALEAGASTTDAAALASAFSLVAEQEAKLVADDEAEEDRFGTSVSLSGDRALIGAYGDEGIQGAAYVFVRSGSTWTQEVKLTADDAATEDSFGISVSLSGDRALIGASLDDDAGTDSGAAYVFAGIGPVATEPSAEVPSGFSLSAAYPNPFNPSAAFTLTLDAAQDVRVSVSDALGREVATLQDGLLGAGTHTLRLEAEGLPSGVYLVRASSPSGVVTQQVTLLR